MDKISLITRSLAKKYTDDSVEGAGAIKGKNCQIQSIAPITGGNRVTFAWYDGEDVLKTGTMDVMDGVDGTDGQDGAKGDKGDKGDTGATGATGNGIASIEKTGTSGLVDTYTITMTNGDTATFTVTNGQDGTATDINAYHVDDTAETGLDDADYVPFYDTSATGMRKSLWSNIKSVLKTYFDTLYKGKNEASGTKIVGTRPLFKFWKTKSWSTSIYGMYIWTDGEDYYCSVPQGHSSTPRQYVLNKTTGDWENKTWSNGIYPDDGEYVWTDGDNIYYGHGSTDTKLVFDKTTKLWNDQSVGNLVDGNRVWTDGENLYYSSGSYHAVYEENIYAWVSITWTGLTDFYGDDVWTDGENIYYSHGSSHYVLNKATRTWSAKTWTGLTEFNGEYIWSDGEEIYYSYENTQYILNKLTSTWSVKNWDGVTGLDGRYIWTNGENIYFSYGNTQLVLDRSTVCNRLK